MKHVLILISALLLSACGFTPMHAGSSGAAFENIEIILENGEDLTDEQAGFFVQQRLRDRINLSANPKHDLVISVVANRARIGITDQDVATRYDTRLSANYELKDKKTGKVLDQGTISSVTTFGAPFDPYGVVTADTSSKQQAAKEISDRLLTSLARYYSANPVQ